MISEKLQNAINEQITAEMWSANLYLAMSFYFEKEGFSGFAHWMKIHWNRRLMFYCGYRRATALWELSPTSAN